jgi:uroporphyrinogen-III synthase/uroporphyrinogen III methyltransferase/synthase
LLTRSAEDCAAWAERLEACGAEPLVLPCIHTEPLGGAERSLQLARAAATADWLVLTSPRGVEAFRTLHRSPLPERVRVATVGSATAAAARAAFGRADFVGGGTAERLAAELAPLVERQAAPEVLIVVAANAGTVLERTLTAAGARCSRVDVYRTVPAPPRSPKQALSALRADNIVLASPSAVAGLVHQVEFDAPAAVYTIGPSTTAAARAHGLVVAAEARSPSFEGILEAMQCRP